MAPRGFAFLHPWRSSPGSSKAKRSPRRLVLEVELLEDRSMLSGVSFLQMPPIDPYASGSVMSDYSRSGPPAALALADLNGDGRLDIITIGPNTSTNPYYPSHQLVWYENMGGASPTFIRHPLSLFPSLPSYDIVDVTSVAAIDVNGDGRTDLVITYTVTNLMMSGEPWGFRSQSLAWLENTGNPSAPFIPHFIGYVDGFPPALSIQDVNGDGRPDIVVAGYPYDRMYPMLPRMWWDNVAGNGTVWAEHPLAGQGNDASWATGDLNGDGYVDSVHMVAPMLMGAQSYWVDNQAPGQLATTHFINANIGGYSWPDVAVGDLNGDGRLDIVFSSSDQLGWLENVPGPVIVTATKIAPSILNPGQAASMLRIDLTNGGLTTIDLRSVALFMAQPAGTIIPANLTASVSISRDNGSGQFNSGDPLLGSVTYVSPLSMKLQVQLNASSSSTRIAGGSSASFFVVMQLSGTMSVASQAFRFDWMPQGTSLVDEATGLGLAFEIGPVTVTTKDIAPPSVSSGQAAAVLRIDVTNSGLTTIDFRSVALFLAEPAGLTNSTPANLTASVSIYGDNGSGQFNSADPLLGSVTNVSLLSTQLQLRLNAGSSSTRVAAGSTASFFVVMQLSSTPSGASPGFEVAWMPQGTSLVDEATGLGLAFEIPANLTSSLVLVPGTAPQS